MTDKEIIQAFILLECEPSCSREDVKASYRQLIKVWHPDRFQGDEKLRIKATEKLKVINEAYGLLKLFFEEIEKYNQSDVEQTSHEQTKNPTEGKTTFRIVSCEKFTLKNGEIFYGGVIEETINSDSCPIFTKQSHIETVSVSADVSFEKASRQSMSFCLPANLGRVEYERHWDGEDDYGVDWKYVFPDKSVIYKYSNRPTYRWKSNPDASPNISDLQETYSVLKQQSNWVLCAEFAQWAIELNHSNPWGWIEQADILLRQGGKREAFDALKHATRHLPSEISIYYNLARYAALLGNQLEAASFLKSVFDLAEKEGPHSGTFQRYRELVLEDSSLICVHNFVPQLPFFWKLKKQFGI